MKPYYEDGSCTIYHGEALAVLAELPEASCDVLLTDPPYSSGGMFRSDRAADPTAKYANPGWSAGKAKENYGTFAGDNRDQWSWLRWVAAWSWASLRVVRPGGHAFIFSDWRQLPAATDAAQFGGWTWRGVVVWDKGPGGGIPSKGKFRNNAEFVVWATHGPYDRPDDAAATSIVHVPPCPTADRRHVTQKPVELLQQLLRVVAVPDPVVLDPFMGSGSTLVAAKYAGHRAIGIEIEERYCEMAANRLAQEVLPLGEVS